MKSLLKSWSKAQLMNEMHTLLKRIAAHMDCAVIVTSITRPEHFKQSLIVGKSVDVQKCRSVYN